MNGPVRPAGFNEFGAIKRVLLRHPDAAYVSRRSIARQWRSLNYTGPPDLARARGEFEQLAALLGEHGASIDFLPGDPALGLDSLYVRDAAIVSPGGLILCNMGKPARAAEPAVGGGSCRDFGIAIKGAIEGDGRLEGGDLAWVDDRTVVVGQGYRSNAEGIRQLRVLLGAAIELVVVTLPHWNGPADVFHLMSMFSPVDRDLAVVYSPLLPVPFRDWLLERGIGLVEVPEAEFSTMGCNVLAVAPRCCIMLDGNPETRAALEHIGAKVRVYRGEEISLKGGGGPTCLTRPIVRD